MGTGGEFSLDEFQQFLAVSGEEGAGPMDPVFVDDEDSHQLAEHLDMLVFDSETDQAVNSIPGLDTGEGDNTDIMGIIRGKADRNNILVDMAQDVTETQDEKTGDNTVDGGTGMENDESGGEEEEKILNVSAELEEGEILSSKEDENTSSQAENRPGDDVDHVKHVATTCHDHVKHVASNSSAHIDSKQQQDS